jgi:hypothetical protein
MAITVLRPSSLYDVLREAYSALEAVRAATPEATEAQLSRIWRAQLSFLRVKGAIASDVNITPETTYIEIRDTGIHVQLPDELERLVNPFLPS